MGATLKAIGRAKHSARGSTGCCAEHVTGVNLLTVYSFPSGGSDTKAKWVGISRTWRVAREGGKNSMCKGPEVREPSSFWEENAILVEYRAVLFKH